jgi:Uma2 family endonuclease
MATAQTELVMRWEDDQLVLDLAPLQGHWTAEQYLLLTDQTNRLIEFTDGVIEVLPMPTENHQAIVEYLFLLLRAFVNPRGGKTRFAPLRVRVRSTAYREPDILLVLDADDPRRQNRMWDGADLVVEVVRPDNPERDTVEKRLDYADAGIAEYWIVDPQEERITVLRLEHYAYVEHGVFDRGDQATSALLQGFVVDVNATLDAA